MFWNVLDEYHGGARELLGLLGGLELVERLGKDRVHFRQRAQLQRHWYFIAKQPAPAPLLARPEGCAALRMVLVTVPRVSRSCEHWSPAPQTRSQVNSA